MRKLSLILIFIILHINAFTQKKFSFPFGSAYSDKTIVSFGIQYNYVQQNYQLQLKEDWQNSPIDYQTDNIMYLGDLKSITSKSGSGFSVGIPIDIRLRPLLYLNTSPSFLFINNLGIEYRSFDPNIAPLVRKGKHELTSTTGTNFKAFEIPINLKLRSEEKFLKNKINKYRAYITGGIRYSKWLGMNSYYQELLDNKPSQIDPIILKPYYFSWDAGIGADIYFDGFKLSPEIKFNQSFTNVLDNKHSLSTNNKFMKPLEKALIRNIYFGLILQ